MRKFTLSNKMLFLIAIVGVIILLLLIVLSFTNSFISGSPSPSGMTAEEKAAQAQSDKNTVQAQKAFLNQYPWYEKIPPPNDKYFIGFDQRNNEFFIDLYSKTPAQTQAYKNEALQQLKDIGVDTSKYSITWTVATK